MQLRICRDDVDMKLGDIFKLSSGKSLPEKKRISGECNVYGGNGITGSHNDYFVEEPTVVIGRVGEYCGAVHLTTEKCWVTDNALMVTEWYQEVDKEYMTYALNAMNLHQYAKTVGQPSISQANVYSLDIELPSIKRQREIVKILNANKNISVDRQHELELLDDLIKARFVELFGNPVLNDKGWVQKSLGEITTKIGSGATPKGGKEAYQEDGITLIRSMNVHNGQFEYKDLAHISDEQAAKLDNVTIEVNDVLLNITGASVARSCVVPVKVLPARVNQHVCIIRCKDCIIPEFLNKLLIDDNYQDLLWGIAGSGATREAITKQQVEGLQIIMPPIELQREFMVFCKQVDKSKVMKPRNLLVS